MGSLISVIIPVYNVLPYLEEALSSVRNQTYGDLEIILIDDGSSDGSGEICDGYAKEDRRMKVIHQENMGLSAARNRGLDISSGEYIAFLDPDDAYLPSFMEKMLLTIERDKTDICECRYSFCKTEDRMEKPEKTRKSKRLPEGIYGREEILRALAMSMSDIHVWNKLYRKELFHEKRFPDGHVYEDIDTTFRIFDRCGRVSVIDEELYLHRRRKGSITLDRSLSNRRDRVTARSHFASFIEENTPGIYSEEQLKRTRASIMNVMLSTYASIDGETGVEAESLRDGLRESIIDTLEKNGIGAYPLRTRAAYRLMRRAPDLFSLIYRIYRPLKNLFKGNARR